MNRSVVAAFGAVLTAMLGASAAARASNIDFGVGAFGGAITHTGSSLDVSTALDLDGAFLVVNEIGGADASGLQLFDPITLFAPSPPSTDIEYGFGDKPSDLPVPLGADLALSWPMGAGAGTDIFTETLTTVLSIDRSTPDAITVALSGTVSDTKGLFMDSPVRFILTASQAGGSGIIGVELTNTSSLAPAVPEPSTWVMMGLGFGALGYAASRGRNASARIAPLSL